MCVGDRLKAWLCFMFAESTLAAAAAITYNTSVAATAPPVALALCFSQCSKDVRTYMVLW